MDLSDETVVAGSYNDHIQGRVSGAAYVFERRNSVWSRGKRILPSDGGAFAFFGVSVAADADTILATRAFDPFAGGASVYVFVRDAGGWTQQTKLTSVNGHAGDQFGGALALDGDLAVVGAWNDDENGNHAGAAYVFARDGTEWHEEAKLLAADGSRGSLGRSVAIAGDVIAVGAPYDDEVAINAGAVYVFERRGAGWKQTAKLAPSAGSKDYTFGAAIDLHDRYLAVGAPELGDGSILIDEGQAYLFARTGSSWIEQHHWFGNGGGLGVSVGVSEQAVLVGAPLGNGAAFAYSLVPDAISYCTSKRSSSGCLMSIGWLGCSSSSADSGFAVTASEVPNRTRALLLYGLNGRARVPFRCGQFCLAPPLYRANWVGSGGTQGPPDCTGMLSLDLNAFASGRAGGTPRPELLHPGGLVQCQWLVTDPASRFGTALTDAVEYTVGI